MSVPNSIHHINILVKDLDHKARLFERLLDKKATFQKLHGRKVKTASFKLKDTYLVLVSPTDADSTVGKILSEQGEGIFLLSLGVDNLDQAIARLEDGDIAKVSGEKRRGIDDWSIQDIEFFESLGFVLQLTEIKHS